MASLANQVRFDRVVEKVKRIIELAFEVGFTFTPANSLMSSGLIEKYDSLHDLQKPVDQTAQVRPLNPIYINEDIFLPLAVNNEFVGVGQLIGAKKLSLSEIKKAGQIIDGLVCGSLTLIDRIQTLERKEEHLKAQINPNIIPISRNLYKKADITAATAAAAGDVPAAVNQGSQSALQENSQEVAQENQQEKIQEKKAEKNSGTNFPTFITAKTTEMLHKIALEIHSKSNKLVLVDVNVLKMPLSVNAIKHFGSVTLFIKDLEELSDQRKDILTAYLKERDFRSTDGPNIIAGSKLSGPELVRMGTITPELYHLLGQVVVQHTSDEIDKKQLDLYVNMVAKAKREFLWFSVIQSLGITPYMSTH